MNTIKIFSFILLISLTISNLSGQVNVEKYRRGSAKDGAAGDIALSLLLIRGNTDVLNLDSSAGLFYKKKRFRFLMNGTLSFGEKNSDKYINKGFLHIRGIQAITAGLSGELFAQREFNEFILLKSRTLAGAGIRIRLAHRGALLLYAGTGLMVEKEVFSERDGMVLKADTKYLKTSNYISLDWDINGSAELGLVTYFQAPFSEFSGYRFLSDLTLKFKLSEILSFFSTLHHRYDNTPPDTIKKYDLTLKSGIGIKF